MPKTRGISNMRIYIDAAPLYNLGQAGSLDVLTAFDGELLIPQAVIDEITVEPSATNLDRFLEETVVDTDPDLDGWLDDAANLLDADAITSDVYLIAGLLAARDRDTDVAIVTDDRRLRALADGLGATVTGTFGTVVGASVGDKYFSTEQAKRLVRRTDHHGTQMTGRLRERAVGEVGS
jgi:predicted nucleic acid-binding protein